MQSGYRSKGRRLHIAPRCSVSDLATGERPFTVK